MSNIDLGDNPQGGTPPDEGQKFTLRQSLGINGSFIMDSLDSVIGDGWRLNRPYEIGNGNPSSILAPIYDDYVQVTFTGGLPDITLYYAGYYNGFDSYTESGNPYDPENPESAIFVNDADMFTYLVTYGNIFYVEAPITPPSYSTAMWALSGVGDYAVNLFIFPQATGLSATLSGQIYIDNSVGGNHYISSLDGGATSWIEFVAKDGRLGTPVSGNLSQCTDLQANMLIGQVAVANGGTGATDRKGASAATNPAIVDSSSTSITLSAATHNGTILRCTSSSAVTITVNSDLGLGFSCDIIRTGTGTVTIVGSGQTIQSYLGTKIAGQYGRVTLTRVATATYNLSGNTSA